MMVFERLLCLELEAVHFPQQAVILVRVED
jgi:hypothetical protein